MPSLATLVRLEFTKAIRRPMTWILGVIFIGFLGFMYTVLALTTFISETQDVEGMDMAGLEDQLVLPDGLGFGSALVVGVGAVVMILFAAGIYGSEFGWATVRMMLMMRAGRTQLVLAKLIMIAIFSILTTIVGMAIVFIGSIGTELAIEGSVDFNAHLSEGLISESLLVTLRSTAAVTVWALIGGMIALAFSSMAIGSGIALAGYFVGDLAVTLIAQLGTIGEWISRLTPTYGVNGMVQLNQTTLVTHSDAEIVGMVASMIAWSVIFVVLGIYRFRNADVIAASG
jgi:ABC-2 type transport system permease protein